MALRQRGNIDNYIDDFEMIAAMIPKETEALYLGCFMNGLRDEIKAWVLLLALETCLNAFLIARNVEVTIGSKDSTVDIARIRAERTYVGGHVPGHSFLKLPGQLKQPQVGLRDNPNSQNFPLFG